MAVVYISYIASYILLFLERAIEELMVYYRKTWPAESITPKMHLLESHAVPFLNKWGAGFGLYREQGAESLDAELNNLQRVYCRMKPGVRRLESMMREHYMRIHPDAKQLRPKIMKRKCLEKEE